VAIAFRPSTFLNFHRAMVQRKYRLLFSPKQGTKPGPKGPTADLIQAVVEMKRRNPTWGCPQIAEQINLAFATSINKDVVRRILAIHYRPTSTEGGPSWLTFIGHMKDSLWSLDLFRCESIGLQTHWVLVVMDQYTRRIIGFGIQRGVVDGLALCRMFKQAIRGAGLPKYLSSDHDPLYRFHQWEANLRILGVTEIKTAPYTPWSHPFVERLIGTIRKECLDRLLFWTATDLEMKLIAFRDYYNGYRSHAGLKGETPIVTSDSRGASLQSYRWQSHCRGLYQTPMAA
jgi:putative transposase